MTDDVEPDLNIRVKGVDLPLQARLDIQRLTVQEDLAVASMFTIELYNWDAGTRRVTWSDSALFGVGNEVEIWLGYVGNLKRVMVGEIISLEPAFHADGVPSLTVRGYDHRHRLLRGRHTRSFAQMKDSAIARQIARAAGLGVQADDTEVTLDYVLQHNQTDLAFLQDRAARIGYEVFVRDKMLYFRPPQNDRPESVTLTLGQDIIEFYPRLSTMAQLGELEVRGWDVKKKDPFAGKARAGSEPLMRGAATSGPRAASKAFGTARGADTSRPVFSRAEAAQMASGQFNRQALAYIGGEGLCYGRADVRAGMVVNIQGAGKTFSGRYYVTSATHRLTPDQRYRTSFTYQRNAT